MAQVSGTERGNPRSTSPRKVVFLVGLLVAVLGGLFVSFAPTASADTESDVAAITNYGTYPQDGLIPDGCTQQGAAVLVGLSYAITHNGVERTATSLSGEQLFINDQVTMSWTNYAAGCEGIGVSLAVKSTDHNTFVITDNQHLIAGWQYCSGSDCGGNGTGAGSLTLHVPSKQQACNFQFDAIIGPPLADVGPAGSYYSSSNRASQNMAHPTDRNMLIGASNGGKGECVPPTVEASQSCTTDVGPGVDVAITNPDPNDTAIVDVLKNGVVSTRQKQVAVGETVDVLVPFGPNEHGTVSVNWTDSAGVIDPVIEIYTHDFTFNCLDVNATITHSCAQGGVDVNITNNGSETATMVVTKGGTLIDTVTVAGGGTEPRHYPMAEDETATYRVTGGGFDSGDVVFTHDCVAAESSTTTPSTVPDTVEGTDVVRSTTLPRTGSSSTMSMSAMAGLLLMTGGLLLALANRPMPTTATASTRSRGR
jgi:LPXTG-motif cell wall-anchored protein